MRRTLLIAYLVSGLLLDLRLNGAPTNTAPPNRCQIAGRRVAGQPGLLPPPITPTGTKRLIFFRARFPDDQVDPISAEEADQTLAEVNALFLKNSFGKFDLQWQISPVLALANGRGSYGGAGGFDRFLEDVRQAGLAAGYNYQDYDLDVIRHSGVPGFMGGNANLGYRGAQVQAPGASIIVHELGHNLGLPHANAWITGSLGISAASPPLPSNYEQLPDPRSIPVYPDSAIGHETVTGPGYSAEYGDLSDIMGLGTTEFSTVYRHYLGWLTDADILDETEGLRVVRIQGTEPSQALAGLPRAVRVGQPFFSPAGERQYWVQLPPLGPDSEPTAPGVQLRWADLSPEIRESLLLAPSASAPGVQGAELLAAGRTFVDHQAHLAITVLSTGQRDDSRWADLAIYHGSFASNQCPSVTLRASALTAAVDEPVRFLAAAEDPDGDALVWRWEFGDGVERTETGDQSKSWRQAGDFVVILEVSDAKGGSARAHVPIRIGVPKTARITGKVLDQDGYPLPGVRVHNGVFSPTRDGRRYVAAITDFQGAYTLAGLEPGTYTPGAYLFGYVVPRGPTVVLAEASVRQVNFTASMSPRVNVTAEPLVSETIGLTNLFVFSRTGPTNEPLTVLYRLGGSATPSRDYVRPLVDRAVIPAGAQSTALLVDVLDDDVMEAEETISVQVVYPSTATRVDAKGNPFTVYYPGWELADIDGQTNWVQTEPSYLPGRDASATVRIQDNDLPQALMASLPGDGTLRLTLQGQAGSRLVLEMKQASNAWVPIRTNDLLDSTTAALTLPLPTQPHALYRTVRY